MIKFFRKIRQHLLSENNFSKYLLYAIGEIILVVIGILIALQINTWNEERKDRIKEQEVLLDLVENLEINKKILEDNIEQLKLFDKSSEIILNSIYNKLPYQDSLKFHFHLARIPKINIFLSNTGIESYKATGLNIVTNKELKKQILNLFGTIYPNTFARNEKINEKLPEFDNHIVQNFIFTNGELEPIDYEKLFTDHYYISWTRAYKEGRKEVIKMESELIKETERVLNSINDELKNLRP
jgi:hypothetical protein